ncbi:rod shape-determining protein MreD [Flavobacterium tibetense]|uniref:Rod shape-determining protein MreD n=1 Tax=Flavobacterium tibetense TaxID=2233533 RepID=A0A365P1P5_9FLAO|nr:rod shape-determining protein MreD [Flavobacterium tibetense]RBA28439.1 rod shape-determining protein MreD [Flavobacterium tibetense]
MNDSLANISRFILFLMLQLLLFNNIDFMGYLNPFPYVLYIILFPVNGNKPTLLVTSFLLGLFLDMFTNSGGVHATASLFLAYVRPSLFKFSFGLSYEYQTVKIADKITPERISFLILAIFIHHLVLFLLEFFRLSLIVSVIGRTFLATIFTFFMCLLIIYLIKPNKR